MAKIDFSKIEGYAEMSAEEKVKVLEDYELVDDNEVIDKLKRQMSKANAEASEYKKKLKEKMTEEELAKAKREEEENALREELETLRKEKAISGYENQYLALGYDTELAKATATAMAGGDMATVFANQKKFNESQAEKFKAEAMKNQPDLSKGGKPSQEDIGNKTEMLMKKAMGLI